MQSPTEETAPAAGDTRAGAEHLLVFPERAVAEEVSETLTEEGFAHVFVVQTVPSGEFEGDEGREGDEGPRWAVRVLDDRLPDTSGGGAYEGLRERFAALATEHGGSYDEPGDPRPPVTARDGATDGPADAAASS
ncbi:ribonuclease E inhibitor RraB [Ornithinimicrobium cryptoxanthini]|uniref:ribonuclease E inhibitor RraB n=1 Tax=Ornithinimicrobium cryptoxanthini TaxID=2934161 RepID=UPI002118C167|nr:ribonuclease E inhibitor RraB [Ornithinimicrobium cryptoxanthini]